MARWIDGGGDRSSTREMGGYGRGLRSWSGAAAMRLGGIDDKEGQNRCPRDGGDGEKLHFRPCFVVCTSVFKGLVRIIT
jgi:hypothetical protein